MKKILQLSLIFTYLLQVLYAQDTMQYKYKEPAFTNLKVDWCYVPQDTSLIGDSINLIDISSNGDTSILETQQFYDGRRHFRDGLQLIDKHYLYTLHRINIFGTTYGGYLSKIDLIDGKLIWTSSFDHRSMDPGEIPLTMYLDNKGNIVIAGLHSNKTGYLWGKFMLRTYDWYSGKLLQHYVAPVTDTSYPTIQDEGGFALKNLNFDKQKNTYDYISTHGYYPFNHYTLDSLGKLLEYHTADLYSHSPYPRISPMFDISNDRYMILLREANLRSQFNDSFRVQFSLQYLSKTLDSISTHPFRVDSFMYNSKLFLLFVDSANVFIRINIGLRPFEAPQSYNIVLDPKANIMDTIQMQKTVGLPKRNFYGINVLQRKKNGFLISTTTYDSTTHRYSVHFLQYTIGKVPILLRSLEIEPEDVELAPFRVTQLISGDYLIKFSMSQHIGHSRKYVYMNSNIWCRIPQSELDLTRTTQVSLPNTLSIRIEPNPAHNYLRISCNQKASGTIILTSSDGNEVFRAKTQMLDQYKINISNFTPGIYVLTFHSDSGKVVSQKLIIE